MARTKPTRQKRRLKRAPEFKPDVSSILHRMPHDILFHIFDLVLSEILRPAYAPNGSYSVHRGAQRIVSLALQCKTTLRYTIRFLETWLNSHEPLMKEEHEEHVVRWWPLCYCDVCEEQIRLQGEAAKIKMVGKIVGKFGRFARVSGERAE